ncbi:hypothetical protein EV384_6381 [Micromonospora kangleipakensis]|uniref:Uncharacterized protein n=1 Tax=Micromonospora kangleipakensis TaxID=1077942 RepID=A0A4Q8BJU8_9ACTN|nr:hypothetical protein [Micromonospora kangleipakensis]RZU77649.1 hypothetical protein EV384_6381 [Micromonospora kangleipakensis]
MRRPLAATMVAAVLLTGAGCADGNDSDPFGVGFASFDRLQQRLDELCPR